MLFAADRPGLPNWRSHQEQKCERQIIVVEIARPAGPGRRSHESDDTQQPIVVKKIKGRWCLQGMEDRLCRLRDRDDGLFLLVWLLGSTGPGDLRNGRISSIPRSWR